MNFEKEKTRIIQEHVPGKQVTLAHIVASPNRDLCQKLGIVERGSLGILTISPAEATIIAADVAYKSANIEIGFIDRVTGSLLIMGDVASVESAMLDINNILENLMGFTPCEITRT